MSAAAQEYRGSDWVQEEVDLAKSKGSLLPIMNEPCELRVGTRSLDYIDLVSWDGNPKSAMLSELWRHLGARLGRAPTSCQEKLEMVFESWKVSGSPRLTEMGLEGPFVAFELQRGVPLSATENVPPSAWQTSEITYWESIRDSLEPSEFEGFIRHFPNSTFCELAISRLESAEWKQIKTQENLDGFLKYISRYPSGRFYEEARRAVEPQLDKERRRIEEIIHAPTSKMSLLKDDVVNGFFKILNLETREWLRLFEEEWFSSQWFRDTGASDDKQTWLNEEAARLAFEEALLQKAKTFWQRDNSTCLKA